MPSDNDELRAELRPAFLEASRVRLRRCALLAAKDAVQNAQLLRAELQTLEGEAAMLGLAELSRAARGALDALGDPSRALNPELERLLDLVTRHEASPG
jgi:hypothetical protein